MQIKDSGKNAAGTIAGLTAATVVSQAGILPGIAVIKGMQKIGNLPADKIDMMHKAAEQAIKDTGLAAKGVKIEYLKEPAIKQGIKALFLSPIQQIKEGFNACFLAEPSKRLKWLYNLKHNTIYMPEKGISFAGFHEIGHAMNYNLTKYGKVLQKLRTPGLMAAGLLAFYGACTKKSEPKEGSTELTKTQKANNFIRNNAGKLAFGAMIPMLAEEALATIKGQKLANKLLSPEMSKIVSKGNKVAYLSYLGTAAFLGLGAWAAVKVKDMIANQKS